MKFAVHLGNFGGAIPAGDVLTLAAAADRLGYDSVWASDHILTPEQFDSVYPYPGTVFTPETASTVYEPITTLAYVAGATTRVRVGTSVLVIPQRNPLILAKQIATLDALSGGRVEIGVGVGWMREEFDILGAPFADRAGVLDEYLALWQTVWTEAIPEFHGHFVDLPPCRFGPLPAQPGGPPISIGGNSTRSLRRAAAGGWGWHAFRLDPSTTARKVAEFEDYWQAAGRERAALRVIMRCHFDLCAETFGLRRWRARMVDPRPVGAGRGDRRCIRGRRSHRPGGDGRAGEVVGRARGRPRLLRRDVWAHARSLRERSPHVLRRCSRIFARAAPARGRR